MRHCAIIHPLHLELETARDYEQCAYVPPALHSTPGQRAYVSLS